MYPDFTNSQAGFDVRILVVDDDLLSRSKLVRALNLVGYHTEEASSGEEALALLDMNPYHILILDLLMTDIDGNDLMQQAHYKQTELMMIVLTASPSLESAITAIKSGAVDYLRKPVSISEVVDTVSHVVKKLQDRYQEFARAVSEVLDALEVFNDLPAEQAPVLSSTRTVLIAPPLKLYRSTRSVTFLDKPADTIELTKGETEVLACLMVHSNHPLSCLGIVQNAWQYDVEKEEAESIVRPYISRLRQKIEEDPKNPCLIRTIRKRGYQFTPLD